MPPPVKAVPLSEIARPALYKIRRACVVLLIDGHRVYYGDWPKLPMMLSRLRDDAGEWLGMSPLGDPQKIPTRPVGEMTTAEIGHVSLAVGALLDSDTSPAIDDPELAECLEGLAEAMRAEKAERLTIQRDVFPTGTTTATATPAAS